MSAAIRIPSLYLIATTDVPVTYGFLNKQKWVKNLFFNIKFMLLKITSPIQVKAPILLLLDVQAKYYTCKASLVTMVKCILVYGLASSKYSTFRGRAQRER